MALACALLARPALADDIFPGMSATVGVKNLLDCAYAYPFGDEFVQAAEWGELREFWLGARLRF